MPRSVGCGLTFVNCRFTLSGMGKRKGKRGGKKRAGARRKVIVVPTAQPVPQEQPLAKHQPFSPSDFLEPSETFYVPREEPHPPHVGAICYLGVLAYPRDAVERQDYIHAAKASFFKWYISRATNLERKRREERIGLGFRGLDRRLEERILKRAYRRILDKRMRAAEVAHWFSIDGMRCGPFEFRAPAGAGPHGGLWKAAEVVGQRMRNGTQGGWDADKVRQRILLDSEPVLHLALALPFRLRDEHGHPRFMPFDWIVRPDWLSKALRDAEFNRCSWLPRIWPKYDPHKAIALLPSQK